MRELQRLEGARMKQARVLCPIPLVEGAAQMGRLRTAVGSMRSRTDEMH